MSHRLLVSTAVIPAALVLLLAQTSARGQTAHATAKASRSTKAWRPRRTPNGRPAPRGYWTKNTITPLERRRGLGTKEFYTEWELADRGNREKNRVALNEEEGRPTGP